MWLERRADIAVLSTIILFFILFFWKALFGGRFFLAGDPLLYSYPLRMEAWEMIRQGSLPLWTPLIFSGYPLLSMAVLGLGYPLTWGYLFLPGQWAEQIYILIPYLLSPFFTYAYAREVGRSRMASLLAGLSFGYGGLMLSLIGLNGMLTNAVMWLPLSLIAIERARMNRFLPCLLLATFSFTMSVLTGIGQGFIYAGALILTYATFITVFWPTSANEHPPDWRTIARYRPLLIAISAVTLSTGVASFQVLETLDAAALSVRSKLSYEVFTYGSFPFSMVWKSLLEPLHNGGDATSYIPLLAFVLAAAAVVGNTFRPGRDARVLFWLAVTVAAFVLMMGMYSPVNRLVYQLPFINRFRVPSRHSFEWTFALSILSAYGWDAIKAALERRITEVTNKQQPWRIISVMICLVLGTVVGSGWWRAMGKFFAGPYLSYGELHAGYLGWKAALFVLTLIAVWQGLKTSGRRWRFGLLSCAIALACFVEPFIQLSHLAIPFSVTSERFSRVSPTTRFLQQYPPEQNRVYSQISPAAEAHSPDPRVDPLNLTMIGGLHNVAGYEPLMLERYSRALNSSEWDVVNRTVGLFPDQRLFEPRSRVLDLLNTTFVVAYSKMRAEPENYVEKDGINFTRADQPLEVQAEKPLVLFVEGMEGDTLALVTSLAHAAHITDGTPVARICIWTSSSAKGERVVERTLRVGIDTAEWAHERADVRPVVRHLLAPVFDSRPGDADNSFPSHRYLARIDLGGRQRITRVEINKLAPQPSVILWKASLYNSAARHSVALEQTGSEPTLSRLDPKRWEVVYQKDGALILRNHRAHPRVWMVTGAEAVTEIEAWRRIRGESEVSFDPKRTALLELEPEKLPALSGEALSPTAGARIVSYAPNHLVIEANADSAALLVVSELFYPGWVATVDGKETPIYRTNYLLRSVALSPGNHRIEMSYQAPAATEGAAISFCILLIAGGLTVYARRASLRREKRNRSN